MFSAIFAALLGVISLGLVLAAVGFYAGWEAQSRMEQDLDRLRDKLRRA